MSNEIINILFNAGTFLIALLSFIVLLIEKISKNSSPDVAIGQLLFFYLKILVIPAALTARFLYKQSVGSTLLFFFATCLYYIRFFRK